MAKVGVEDGAPRVVVVAEGGGPGQLHGLHAHQVGRLKEGHDVEEQLQCQVAHARHHHHFVVVLLRRSMKGENTEGRKFVGVGE